MAVNDKQWPSRLHALDVSRGVASLSVVVWHWQHFASQQGWLAKDFERSSQPLYSFLRLFYETGHAGVQYFFLLSGFVFFWLYRDAIRGGKISSRTFFFQRFSRLYPLHLLTLLLVALLQYFFIAREGYYFVYQVNDLNNFFLHLGFASGWGLSNPFSFNAPVWSVSVEVLLYLVFFLVALRFKCAWFFCITVAIAAYFLNMLSAQLLWPALSAFFFGGFIFHLTSAISKKYLALTYPITLLTCMLWGLVICNFYLVDIKEVVHSSNHQPIQLFYQLVSPLFSNFILFPMTILTLALIEINRGHFLQRISWVGDITYSSYLLHFPLQLCFALGVSHGILQNNFYLSSVSFLVFFVLLVPLSIIVFQKFERPSQGYIRGRFLTAFHER